MKGVSLLKVIPRLVMCIKDGDGGFASCPSNRHAASAGCPKTRIGSYCC